MALSARQKFSQDKIDKLVEYLNVYKDKGQPIDYEIIVDGFKAVRRTSDPEMFTIYENFVSPDSKSIEILFYTGTSNNNDKHIFTFQDEQKEQGLSGIEIDNRIQEGIEKEKRSWEFESLRKKVKDLEKEVEELEEEIETLEKEKEELRSKESPLKGILGEVGSTLVEGFIRRNPRIIAKLPGGEALAGLIEEDNKERDQEEELQETEVSFKAKSASTNKLSEEDHYAITFVGQLKSTFTKPEFDKILEVMEHFATDKNTIDKTLSKLKKNNND